MKKILLSFAVVALLTGCADNQSQNVYNTDEIGKQADIEFGVIKAIKHVKIQQKDAAVGTGAGAVAGGVAGSTLGGGKGALLTAIAGAVVGGVAGNAAEHAITNDTGIEYVIKKENGKIVSIVQNIGKDDQPLRIGQRVMIQTSGQYQKASAKNHGSQYQRVLPADDSENGQ